ncbi:hypothetical protein M979_0300 [Buttiauxella noackiae ATCC 51607]|uniref:Uncharacterized protein n=1 Tax=Buttiauxella noackiae ATCC 51607 TaxID=1354255 RepID=A0A1B7I0K6_9ENTR|nr:hypothetical protein M979_0300 [Buttiauxella noackiae ATCC 51607]
MGRKIRIIKKWFRRYGPFQPMFEMRIDDIQGLPT